MELITILLWCGTTLFLFANDVIEAAGNKTLIRLVGGHNHGTGRLELFIENAWRSVYSSSSYYFSDEDTKVACMMLGFGKSGIAYKWKGTSGSYIFGEGNGRVIYQVFGCVGNETDLVNCVGGNWRLSSNSHIYDVSISCEKTPIRLADGDTPKSGRIEILVKDQWSSVCESGFDKNDASVVCNMLGYNDTGIAKAFNGGHFGMALGAKILSSLDCDGIETDIKQCDGSWGSASCDHIHYAGVSCGSTPIRLANGPNNSSGRVEVKHGGEWGTICGYNGFTQQDVIVICRMLGFNSRRAFGYTSPFFGEGIGQVTIEKLQCDGTENDIANCDSNEWRTLFDTSSSCSHTYDVGVNCEGDTVIRLADGPTKQTGRLEVLHNGYWGTVYDQGFDRKDLVVVCKMLGFEYTTRSFFMPNSFYGEGLGEVVVSNLQCSGAEKDIGSCSGKWWPNTGVHDHDNDVGVSCDGAVDIRLADGDTNSSGRVEVLHEGYYGTVCSSDFDRLDLLVVCRLLGFGHATRNAYWYPAAAYYQGIGEIVVSDLKCNGIESSIGQCHGTWPASRSCGHSQDVYVNCDGHGEKLRLVDGKNKHSGRVEIFHEGQWATICGRDFDRADAVVICRILGFSHPERAVAYTGAHFGSANSSTPIAMRNLQCNGMESNLGQCDPTWTQISSYCSHGNDAGVDCCDDCGTVLVG